MTEKTEARREKSEDRGQKTEIRGQKTEDTQHATRPDIYTTYHGNQFGLYSQRMVRDHRWKYIWNATAEDELYDLLTDPGEITNLAADPAYAVEGQRLRQRILAWMEETNDRLLNPWIRQQLAR